MCLAVPLIMGFLVSLGISVYHVYAANEDRRSELVAAYDSSVEAWMAGDAETYARKWTGDAALSLPSLTVDRDDLNHVRGSFSFGVFQSGPEAFGALRDPEPDYRRYDQGTMLQATIENFFDDSLRVGMEDVRFVVGNTTVTAEAIKCNVEEHCEGGSSSNSNSGSSGSSCTTQFEASVAFLQSVRLVDLSGDADAFLGVEARANACAFEYTSFIGGEPFSSRAEAQRMCDSDLRQSLSDPTVSRDVSVTIRSPSDPYVKAMELTRERVYDVNVCSGDFGMSVEELQQVALDSGIAAGVLGALAATAIASAWQSWKRENAERSAPPAGQQMHPMAFAGAQQPTQYGGPQHPMAYGGPQHPMAYGGPQQPMPYGGPQQPMPYGGPQQPMAYGGPQQPMPYGGPQQPMPYGGPQQPMPYGGPQHPMAYAKPQ